MCSLQTIIIYTCLNMLNAAGLLINSLDRLVVVWKPLFYFRNGAQITILLLGMGYIIAFAPSMGSIAATLLEPSRKINHLCLLVYLYDILV